MLLIPVAGMAQEKHEDLVDWSASRLSWADYKAKAEAGSDAAAITTTYLSFEYNVGKEGLKYTIQCRFSRNRSWGLHKTDYILSHEQGHFDIAEIYARKLHKAMSEYAFNRKTFQQDLKKIYETVMDEKDDMQNRYDKETNHSIKRDKQAEWLTRIAELLEEYKDYAGYR